MAAERTKAFRPLRGRDGKPSRRTSKKTIWWPQRDSNPRLGLERASPRVVISPTSTPGATARCHSAGSFAAGPRKRSRTIDQSQGREKHRISDQVTFHSRRTEFRVLAEPHDAHGCCAKLGAVTGGSA